MKIVEKDKRDGAMIVDLNTDGIREIRTAAVRRDRTQDLMEGAMSELERAVPNTVYQQAVEKPVSEHVIVNTLAANGRRDPDAIRDALEAAVERGDVEHVEGSYQPGEWDEYRAAGEL